MNIINKLNPKNKKNCFKINKKGFIFSTDLIISIIIILFSITSFLIIINNNLGLAIKFEKEKYVEQKTIFVADSFVKNFSEENAMLGSCIIDFEKKRVLSNEISSTNFSNIKELKINDFFIKKIESENIIGKKIIYSNNNNMREIDCISVKRFVFLDGIKSIISFTGCLNE